MTRSGQGLLSTGNGSPIRKRLKQNISDRGYANGIDRISNLPDPIVSKILSFLPTKNAVATSALSKRWKPRWTKVTSFDFDDELWAKRRGRGKTVPKKDFAEFVEMVLKNQTADSTNQFRLRWNSRDQNSFLGKWANQVKLPIQLYTRGKLEVLKLAGPVFINLPNRVYLPKLAVLELNSVSYKSDQSLVKLLSGCPVLQSLMMKRTSKRDNLVVCTISSPTLKHLQISFSFEYDFYSMSAHLSFEEEEKTPVAMKLKINAPALECLVLNDASSETISVQGLASVREAELEKISHCDDDMVVGLVQALESVKCMKLGLNVMHTLSVASNKLSGSFARLTRLAVTCDPNQHMGCLVELMDCCVKLEVIKIVISMSEEPEDVSDQDDSDCKLTYWKDPVRVPSCLSSSLRQVAIRGFHDDNGLMAMLKFILDHGLVMERVNLWFLDDNEADEYEDGAFEERERCYDDIPVDYEERYRLLGKILMLSRASPACQIQDLSVS